MSRPNLTERSEPTRLANKPASTTEPIAVYVHIPFCPSKCGYCDFNSYGVSKNGKPGLEEDLVGRTVDAIVQEIKGSPVKGRPAKTIFIGGGTPTYLSAPQLERVLEAVLESHPPLKGAEVTSEANPGTVDASKFGAMKSMGFNRLSMGAQSFNAGELRRLGRIHGAEEIESAVHLARQAGFENLNLDLMFGLPLQTPTGWKQNLSKAIDLGPDHLSLYCLTIEPRTAFKRQYDAGKLPLPSDEKQIEMYDLARDMAMQNGYEQYEISNFAKPGLACQHNLCYWHGEEYAGYGPGAVGCLANTGPFIRATNLLHPRTYCQAVETGAELKCQSDDLSDQDLLTEKLMLGIRLNEGIDIGDFEGSAAFQMGLTEVVDRGWATLAGDRLILTRLGQNFCSEATILLI